MGGGVTCGSTDSNYWTPLQRRYIITLKRPRPLQLIAMIETIIQTVISKIPARLDDGLIGFTADVQHYLSQNKLFHQVVVHQTNDPSCAVQVLATASADAASLQEISHALLEVWSKIRYMHLHAASCVWTTSNTQLRFVTVPSSEHYCVTGKIMVNAPQHQQLVELYRRCPFGPLSNFA